MKINSLYTLMINRFKITEKIESRSEGRCPAAQKIPGDRTEISRLVAALREAELREDLPGAAENTRLNRLEEMIRSGNYRVDRFKLAGAMLQIPDEPRK